MKKYYVQDDNQTIHYGEEVEVTKNYPSAVEISAPPSPSSYYKWDGSKWFFEKNLAKVREIEIVTQELMRLIKFEMLPAQKRITIDGDLEQRKSDLNIYLNNLAFDSVMPVCPSSLMEDNYFTI